MDVTSKQIQKNTIWNVTGSLIFAGSQFAMSVLIVHLAGYAESGILSLGLSLTNAFINIGYFGIRSYQVSDINRKFETCVYVSHRLLTCSMAFLLYLFFVLENQYSTYKMFFLLAFMCYRLLEAWVDVYHGINQLQWRLDIAGISYVLRALGALAVFVILENWTHNLVITSFGMFFICLPVIIFFDIPQAKKRESYHMEWNKGKLISLTKECFPLFLYTLCINFLLPIPRYFLERYWDSATLGYYSTAASLAVTVQLLSAFVFNPFITLFAQYIAQGDKRNFLKLFLKLFSFVLGLTLAATIISYFLCEPVLLLIFNEELRPYVHILDTTIAACGLMATIMFFGTVLIVLRKKTCLLLGAVVGVICTVILSVYIIPDGGIFSVNYVSIVGSICTLIIYLCGIIHSVKGGKVFEKS